MRSQNDRLEFAIIISLLLHTLLIGLFLLGSFFTNTKLPESAGGNDGNGEEFQAVMVDTGQVAAEYGRLQSDRKGNSQPKMVEETKPVEDVKEEVTEKEEEKAQLLAQQKEEQRQEQIKQEQQRKLEQQRQELLKQEQLEKQREEATRKKAAEAARLKAEAEAKRLEAAAKQAEEERKAKEALQKAEKQKKLEEQKKLEQQKAQEAKEKAKAEQEAKAKAEKEAKEKANIAKAKAAADAKAKADQEAKAAAVRAKNNKALDDFVSSGDFGGGSATKGGNKNSAGLTGNGNGKAVGDGQGTADRGYERLIKQKLSREYQVDPSFSGRECRVKINIERDGRISSHQVISGPPDICRAAVAAITRAQTVPSAKDDPTYNTYKSPTIKFGLKVL